MSCEDDNPVNTKCRRTVKNLKRNSIKSLILIFVMILCLVILILNNIRTYGTCGLLVYQIEEMKKKQAQPQTTEKQNVSKANNVISPQAHQESIKKINKLLNENDYLKKINKNISEDNVSLQNSLKIAAMAGIKPQNYTRPSVVTSRSMHERWKYIGKFKGTAYTPSASECGNSKGITFSGKPIIPGTTIAVDTRYWPIGTEFYVKGIGYVTAMDTGNAVKGKNRFDFAVFNKKFAYALGTRNWEVYLVRMGTGRI